MTRAAKKPRPDALDRLLAHVDKFSVPSNGRGYDSSLDAAKRKTRRLVAALRRQDVLDGIAQGYAHYRGTMEDDGITLEQRVRSVLRRPRKERSR